MRAKNQHLTNGIRCAACSAARGSKNTSRAYALCGVFSHPHSSPPAMLRIALLGGLERRQPFTLGEIKS